MQLSSVCNRVVVIVKPSDSILEAAKRMRSHHVGTLVVVDDSGGPRKPVGIITDRDIVVSVVAENSEQLAALTVADVMSKNLMLANEDESLDDVLQRMRRRGVRRVPVVDAKGVLLGILAMDDVLELVLERLDDVVELVVQERRREEERRPGGHA